MKLASGRKGGRGAFIMAFEADGGASAAEALRQSDGGGEQQKGEYALLTHAGPGPSWQDLRSCSSTLMGQAEAPVPH